MDKFILIDGNSLINRAFYATPPMSNSKGVSTNAIYAFCNMLVKLIVEEKPKYILVAFDRHEPTFRHKLFEEYKGTRKPSPVDLHEQINLLKQVLDELGIARFEFPSFEADDIIGTLAKKYSNVLSVIITGDKDSFQLVDDSTEVHFTKRGISDVDVYNSQNFYEKLGYNPKQVIDMKSLMGDSSDNIPGVLGVGEKTALNLVQTYGSRENLYEHISEISGKLFEKLKSGEESSKLSKVLATINTQVPIDRELESYEYKFPFAEKSRNIFLELELRNFLKKEGCFCSSDVLTDAVEKKYDITKTVEIYSKEQIMPFIKNTKFAVIIGYNISFYVFDDCEVKLHINEGFLGDGFSYEEAISALKPIFENENNLVVLYYKNQIRHMLINDYNISIKAKVEDVSIMKYLLDYTGKDDKLEDVFTDHNLDKATPAYSLYLLYKEYSEKLIGDEKNLYDKIEMPLCDVLYDMECAGFKIDKNALEDMGKNYKTIIEDLLAKIKNLAGCDFNPSSPKQLSSVLFDKLQLKHGKKSKSGGFSTNVDILEELSDEHEIIPLILQFRHYSKLNSTYIEGFKTLIDKNTQLVHTTFNQVQTATGRLSSREPNLQNIPIRNSEGREIRRLFSARDENHILIDADYSQIEMRLLAHCSNSSKLIEAFNTGIDIHSTTASQVFGVDISQVTKEMRSSAKAVNFGIIYGISDFGLSKNLKIPVKTAGEYIKKYFETYPNIKEYMENNVKFAQKNGYAVTLFGRKRYIREINSSNYNLRSFGERVAMNMPLQGTAADIMKIAMINVEKRLKENNLQSKLILQVHDELVIDALKNECELAKKILVEEMENAVKLSVPLTVEASVCDNWYDAK